MGDKENNFQDIRVRMAPSQPAGCISGLLGLLFLIT